MSGLLARARQPADLLRELVARELRLRYRRSVIGVLWSQLQPLTLLVALTFIFTRVVPLAIPHYVVHVLIGLLAWTWFSAGLTAATNSVVAARDLVRLPGFRSELLPAVAVAAHLTQLLLALPVLAVAVLIDVGAPGPAVLALPPVLAAQFLLTLGPGYLLAAWHVRFRDVGHLVAAALPIGFWATPVFYDAAAVPERLRAAYDLNPLVHVLEAYRAALIQGTWPSWRGLAYPLLLGLALTVAGLRSYMGAASHFAEEL